MSERNNEKDEKYPYGTIVGARGKLSDKTGKYGVQAPGDEVEEHDEVPEIETREEYEDRQIREQIMAQNALAIENIKNEQKNKNL